MNCRLAVVLAWGSLLVVMAFVPARAAAATCESLATLSLPELTVVSEDWQTFDFDRDLARSMTLSRWPRRSLIAGVSLLVLGVLGWGALFIRPRTVRLTPFNQPATVRSLAGGPGVGGSSTYAGTWAGATRSIARKAGPPQGFRGVGRHAQMVRNARQAGIESVSYGSIKRSSSTAPRG